MKVWNSSIYCNEWIFHFFILFSIGFSIIRIPFHQKIIFFSNAHSDGSCSLNSFFLMSFSECWLAFESPRRENSYKKRTSFNHWKDTIIGVDSQKHASRVVDFILSIKRMELFFEKWSAFLSNKKISLFLWHPVF